MLKVKAVDGLAFGETAFAKCGASTVDHFGLGEQPREGLSSQIWIRQAVFAPRLVRVQTRLIDVLGEIRH
jgi:hypothetical protein